MSWVAAAIVGGAVIGGVASGSASRSAARAQENAADRASDTQLEMFERNREDMAPWRQAGVNALGYMAPGIAPGGEFNRDFTMADFEADPGYAFRLNEGVNALDRSAASRGLLRSGRQMKGITRFGQDMASQEYTNAFNRYQAQLSGRYNRLAGVAGTGQTAATQVGNWGANTANNVAGNVLSAGNARASGYVGTANAVTGAIGNGINWYQQYNAMRPSSGPGWATSSGGPGYAGEIGGAY